MEAVAMEYPKIEVGGYCAAYLLDPDGNNIEAGIRTKVEPDGAG